MLLRLFTFFNMMLTFGGGFLLPLECGCRERGAAVAATAAAAVRADAGRASRGLFAAAADGGGVVATLLGFTVATRPFGSERTAEAAVLLPVLSALPELVF